MTEPIDQAEQAIQNRILDVLEREGAVEPGVHGYIPAFTGADAAADRFAQLPAWQSLPETTHDFSVDLIVTPGEVIECGPRRRPAGLDWAHPHHQPDRGHPGSCGPSQPSSPSAQSRKSGVGKADLMRDCGAIGADL